MYEVDRKLISKWNLQKEEIYKTPKKRQRTRISIFILYLYISTQSKRLISQTQS